MKNLVLLVLLLLSREVFAGSYDRRGLSPAVDYISDRFPENELVIQNCLLKKPSKNLALGCVQALKYMHSLCELTLEPKFNKRYRSVRSRYFDDACELSLHAETKLPDFFEMDIKSCVNGFESIPKQLKTLKENRELFEVLLHEKYAATLEKKSCNRYHKYVNLCVYLDGELKNYTPFNFKQLPSLKIGKTADELCNPSDSNAEFLYEVDKFLYSHAGKPIKPTYEEFLKSFRKQTPARSQVSPKNCQMLRQNYTNLDCAKYENWNEEEINWVSEEDLANGKKRKQAERFN